MLLLIAGLIVFLGVHSIRMFADDKRSNFIAQKGEKAYKGMYTILSLAGFALLVYGYGITRSSASYLWHPPALMLHVAALLTLFAFILLAASYVPRNHISQAVGHPMVLGVKVWAFAHLLANGRAGDVVLFGSFLVWAIVNYVSSRKRDRLQGGSKTVTASVLMDVVTVVAGVLAWVVFALWAHRLLIGVSPFGA